MSTCPLRCKRSVLSWTRYYPFPQPQASIFSNDASLEPELLLWLLLLLLANAFFCSSTLQYQRSLDKRALFWFYKLETEFHMEIQYSSE